MAVINSPKNTAASIFLLIKIIVKSNPNTASNTVGFLKFPNVISVAGCATAIPAFTKPIKAIKNPVPAPILCFKFSGIEFIILSLIPVAERIKNNVPETKTIAKAS